jgi:hypothetical protein
MQRIIKEATYGVSGVFCCILVAVVVFLAAADLVA